MGKRILFLHVAGHNRWDQPVQEFLKPFLEPDTVVDVESLNPGLPQQHEYLYFMMLSAEKELHRILRAEKEGYDAVALGCYADPCLEVAKEVCSNLVVTGPAESAMHIATTLGTTFSVIAVRNKPIPDFREQVHLRGFDHQLASMRSLDIPVNRLLDDPAYTHQRIREEAYKAVYEDHAEVVVLGCTVERGVFQSLQEELGVPVIDANIAPVKYAEFLIELKRSTGWYYSQKGKYESPDAEEIRETGVADYFSIHDIWG